MEATHHEFFASIKTHEHVKYFRHALALDESLEQLLPERITHNAHINDRIKEVWFAGTRLEMFVACLWCTWVSADALFADAAQIQTKVNSIMERSLLLGCWMRQDVQG